MPIHKCRRRSSSVLSASVHLVQALMKLDSYKVTINGICLFVYLLMSWAEAACENTLLEKDQSQRKRRTQSKTKTTEGTSCTRNSSFLKGKVQR